MSDSKPRKPARAAVARAGSASKGSGSSAPTTDSILAELERLGTKATRDGLSRYGIVAKKAFGVPVGVLQELAKRIGRDHELALSLWSSGWYEARLLASFVDEPARVTPSQMDRWARDFDNWGVVDTACFALFDRTPHALGRVDAWSRREEEFVKRGAFALLACVSAHDKGASEAEFLRRMPLIEAAATDERNFVKKGVSWALRMVGRRSLACHRAALELARRLAASKDPTSRWIGKDALRDLSKPAVIAKLKSRKRP